MTTAIAEPTAAPAATTTEPTQPTTTPPAPSQTVLTSPTPNTDWRSQLSDEYKDNVSLKDIKDINGLVKSYIHAQTMVGTEKIAKPNEKWTPDQWNQFYNTLGRPEAPDKYKFADVKLPENLQTDNTMVDHFRKVFHDAGLSQKQADVVYGNYMKFATDNFQKFTQDKEVALTQANESMKKEFGAAYDERIKAAQLAINYVGDKKFNEWLESSGMGNQPEMIKFFADLGTVLMEDEADGVGKGSFTMTTGQAAGEIKQLSSDKEFQGALLNSAHAGHRDALDKWQQLHKWAYPGNQPAE